MGVNTNSSEPFTGNQQNHDESIEVFQLDSQRLHSLQQKITTPPRLLSKSAGKVTCSIFKVPQSFVNVNGDHLYHPHIVSIGPYHRNKLHLQMIEERKYVYLGGLLSRCSELTLEKLFNSLQPLEKSARESYSEIIDLDEHEFVEMMVVDGCFVLELFRKVAKLVRFETDDPIASMQWVFSFLLRDLLRLENQLPLFVLERLWEVSRSAYERGSGWSLVSLSLHFFSYGFEKLEHQNSPEIQGKHLLDVLRSAFIPPELETRHRNLGRISIPSHVIHNVSKLYQAGVQLRSRDAESFLSVQFHHGVIEMPTVTIDDFMTAFFANCVAYELSHKNCTTYFTTYLTFLDYLVNSARDVEYLIDQNIIENYYGNDADIAKLINNLGKDVSFDISQCYLAELFNQVNDYYNTSWHVHWASFKYTYFNTPWTFISAVAAFVLLVLSFLQTLYSILSYVKQ
ncbi:hypothetical protein Ancab_031695 [Ancistrocladus abbreviatus]